MGFFKSQMWKVLEWKDDSSDTLVYRFPMDGKEIMSGSQLTVRESQVAVFVNLGKVADVFGQGKLLQTTCLFCRVSAVYGIRDKAVLKRICILSTQSSFLTASGVLAIP